MTAPTDVDLQRLARTLGDRLQTRSETLVKVCTDVAGSSRWFLGGMVAYSNELKVACLGVPETVLAAHGAVSEPVVDAMARGCLARMGGAVAVAVSGVAGPEGGTVDKPVGTVWLAWAWRTSDGTVQTATRRELFPGNRDEVRRWTVGAALERLLAA
jgi:nicotinamide-nucleotide amidase